MSINTDETTAETTWFVGASYDGTEDQMPRFIADGIWENGHEEKHLDVVQRYHEHHTPHGYLWIYPGPKNWLEV